MENGQKYNKRIWIISLIVCQTIIVLYQYFFSQNINSKLALEIQRQTEESASRTVQLAYNSIEHIIEKTRTGEFSKNQARKAIADIVRKFTYNDDKGQNYVFMSSYDGIMLVQPFEPDKEGTNQLDLKDADGNYIIRELISAAKKYPEGSFVTYSFYPPNHTIAEEKLSYVMGIPEIDAYIGTGMYAASSFNGLKQILKDQKLGYINMNFFVSTSLLLFILILYRNNKQLTKEINDRINAENNIMTVFDTIYDGVLIHDDNGRILQANKSCCKMFDLTEEEITGLTLKDLYDDNEDPQKGILENKRKMLTENHLLFEWKGRRPHSGELFDAEVISKKTFWSGREVYVVVLRDISDKKQAEAKLRQQFVELENTRNELQHKHDELSSLYEELAVTEEELRHQYDELIISEQKRKALTERYMLVADGASDIVWDWDSITGKLFMSDRFGEILGYSKGEVNIDIFEDYLKFLHPNDKKSALHGINTAKEKRLEYYSFDYRMMKKDGSYGWFSSRSKFIYGDNGKAIRIAGSISDITQHKKYEEEIKRMAYYDYLTGLPNRISLFNELKTDIEDCISNNKSGSVTFIDLDNFKIINDTFGHSYGDMVLVRIAEKLKKFTYENTRVYRIGGDEFILVQNSNMDGSECVRLAESILDSFYDPINIDDNSFQITCSVGVAVYPKDGSSVEEILKYADLAMYKGKNSGKNTIVYYEPSIGTELSERIQLERDLKEAFENSEFELYYQPQVSTESKRITGFEALLRWNSSKYGQVSPSTFIHVAEETGLINDIGKWVIDQSFAFAKKLQGKEICISCNVSPVQLIQSDFVEAVIQMFDVHGLESGSVALEITENSLVESFEDTNEKLKKIREKGIMIYLDDFGTGYSSLTYLKNLPIDVVKIDKLFVDDIINEGAEKSLIKSILSLAHDIGLKVVSEGVEEEIQREYLVQYKCDFIQGYLISKPIPEKLAVAYLSNP